MGKCIVCNKFAGPFYKLHKSCYQVYNEARGRINRSLTHAVSIKQPVDELQIAINACRPASNFSYDLFSDLLKQGWEMHAKEVLNQKPLDPSRANYLLEIASNLKIFDSDVESNLLYRLSNLDPLVRIQQNQELPSIQAYNIAIEFAQDESLYWVFENTFKIDQHRYAQSPQTTIFQTILNNLFSKSRYKELDVNAEDSGKLAITNQNLYYVSEIEFIKIALSEFYSVTPMKEGVRIQTTERTSMPSTFVTGDGRFTYELLLYLQNKVDKV